MVALAASADVDVGVNSTACPVYLVLLEDEQLADAVAAELRARLTVKGRRTTVLVPPVRGGAFFEPAAARWAQAWWIAQGLGGELSGAIPIALDDARLGGLDRTSYVALRPGDDGVRRYGAAVRTVPAGTVRELVDAIVSDASTQDTGEEVTAGSRCGGATPDSGSPDNTVEQCRRVVVFDPSVRRGRRLSRAKRRQRRGRMAKLLSTTLLAGALGIGGWLVSAAASPSAAHATTVSHHHPASPLTPQLRQAGWRIVWVRTPAGYLPRLVQASSGSTGRGRADRRSHPPRGVKHHGARRHAVRQHTVRQHAVRQRPAASHPTGAGHAATPSRADTSPASMFPRRLLRQFGIAANGSPVGSLTTPRTPWHQAGTPKHRSATRLSPTTTSSHHGTSARNTRRSDGPGSALPLLALPLLGTDDQDGRRTSTHGSPGLTRAGPILGGDPLGGLRPAPPAGTAVPYSPGEQAHQDPCRTWYQQQHRHRPRHCTGSGGEPDQSGYPEGSGEPGYWYGSGYPGESGYPETSEGYGDGGGFGLPTTPVSPGAQQSPQAQPAPPGPPPVGGFPGSDAPGTPPTANPPPDGGAPLSGLTRTLLKGITIGSGVLGGMSTGFELGEPLALGACVLSGGVACIPAEIGALGATVIGGIIGGVTAGNAFDKAYPSQPEPTKPPAGMEANPGPSSFMQSLQDLANQQDTAQPAFQMSDQSPGQSYSDNSDENSDDESYSDSGDSSDDEDYSDSSDSSDDEDYSDSSDSSDDSGDGSGGDASADTGGGDTSGGDGSGLSDSNNESGEGPLDDGSQDDNNDSGEGPLDSGGGGDTGGDGYPSEA